MIRAIIVDDEFWVCELISELIDWNSHGFEIIGQAYDGDNALKLIDEKYPDIVFTDIRMPGISGLELIETCSMRHPDIKFVIISGHSDFQYAQDALRKGALGYLLKPVESGELIDLLKQIKEKIFISQKKFQEEDLLKNQLNEKKLKFKEQYFFNLFRYEIATISGMTTSQINRECDSSFQDGLFQIIQFVVDNQQLLSAEFYNDVYSLLSKKCHTILSPLCYEMISLRQNASLIILMNFDTIHQIEIEKLVRELYYTHKQTASYLANCEFTLGLGLIVTSFSELAQSIQTAQEAIYSRIRLGTNKIIETSNREYPRVNMEEIFTNELKKLILDYLYSNTEYTSLNVTTTVFNKCIHDDSVHPAFIINLAEAVIRYLYSVSISKNLNINSVMPFEETLRMLDSLYQTDQVLSFFSLILDDIKKLCTPPIKSLSASETIKNYLDDNYYKDISLCELSELVFLNSKYISELFKKEFGVTISDYLASRRIGEAKHLLLNSSMSITEISEKSGYNDPKYFAKLFKRIIGVSPTQFRKMYQ